MFVDGGRRRDLFVDGAHSLTRRAMVLLESRHPAEGKAYDDCRGRGLHCFVFIGWVVGRLFVVG